MRTVVVIAVALTLLASCVSVKPPIHVSRGPGAYTVKRGDTLYSIAWRYGLDYKQLAQWNRIAINEPIFPGQRLSLLRPRGTPAAAREPATVTGTAAAPKIDASPSDDARDDGQDPRAWRWPTAGKPLNTFSASQLDRRGIDIAGKPGQPVRAVADGRVVYSGNGLAGYGNLIIIKHSDTFLSAYAYCQERLVQEGASVKAGDLVAKMGRRDDQAKLHFEIRRNGKPVDPMKYLPDL